MICYHFTPVSFFCYHYTPVFFDPVVGSRFMKMHERIRRKVHITYSSDKTWKSSILDTRFIKNADLAAFSKDFLLLNKRKQTMRIKRACPKLSDLEIWYKVPPLGPNQLGKFHWKRICWALNVFSERPRKDMELTG